MEKEISVLKKLSKLVYFRYVDTGESDLCSIEEIIENNGKFYIRLSLQHAEVEKKEAWVAPFWAVIQN